jgi:conjugative relaxase-like TrwC/TraI family protein
MVVSINVLGKAQRGGSGPFDGKYFMNLANSKYFTEGGEPPGQWYGRGAASLGLQGEVDAIAFEHLLAGRRPDGSPFKETRQMKNAKQRRKARAATLSVPKHSIPGYDICYSAPKSVSALWAVAPDAMRREIESAFDSSVNSSLAWLESNIPLVRRGRGGIVRQLAELVILQFGHGTSRVTRTGGWEPQLHKHCIVVRPAKGEDGRWTSVNSRVLHEWARTLGPMFRATLAHELQSRIGLELICPLDNRGNPATWFEIAGVPEELCRRWSSRRGEIEELLAATLGIAGGADAKAREAANLLTRTAKPAVPPRAQLFSEWSVIAHEHSLTKAKAESLQTNLKATDPEVAFQKAWKAAQDRLDESQSNFTYREAVQRVCEAAQTLGVSGTWLADRTSKELYQSREMRPLGILGGEERFATERMWNIEKELLAEFAKLRGATGAVVDAKVRNAVLDRHPQLMEDQRDAVGQILDGKGALRILTGVAGAGKSTTLDVVREALERSGYKVIGGAIAGVAKEELALKAKIPSRTIASYLYHLEKTSPKTISERARHFAKQLVAAAFGKPTDLPFKVEIDKKTVLVLDEAGMVDSRTQLKLAQIVRERGGTLLLVGDTAQLQSIGAGGSLQHLLGKEKSPKLSTNLRQQNAADRDAADKLRHGDAKAAIENYVERGRLSVLPDRAKALTALVETWSEAGGVEHPEQHIIFTSTRAEAHAANQLAQRAREAAGKVDRVDSLKNGDGVICRGDRVLFHKNIFADGIRNGYRGEVTEVDRFCGLLTIRLDGPEPRQVTIRLRDYGANGLTLGMANTSHKTQGMTVDHSYILAGGKMADREMAYVQATRGRLSTHLFVDEAHAGVELQDLARAFSRSRKKELAHDVAAKAKPLIQKHASQELGL